MIENKSDLMEMTDLEIFEYLSAHVELESSEDIDSALRYKSIIPRDSYLMVLQVRAVYMLLEKRDAELLQWVKRNGHKLVDVFGEVFMASFLQKDKKNHVINVDNYKWVGCQIHRLFALLGEESDISDVKVVLSKWCENFLLDPYVWPSLEILSAYGVTIPSDPTNVSLFLVRAGHELEDCVIGIKNFADYGLKMKQEHITLLPLVLALAFYEAEAVMTPLEYMNNSPRWQHPFVLPYLIKKSEAVNA